MSSLNTAIYAGDVLNPVNISGNTADIQGSGFSTIILGLCHIGRGPGAHDPVSGQQTGDFVFNNPNQSTTDPSQNGLIVISGGQYVGPSTWPGQLQSLISSSSGQGSITRLGWSVGGGGCEDYQTIWANFVVNGSISPDTVLYQNFVALKQQFPFVDFIDFDCEEFGPSYPNNPSYNWTETLIAFGNMLKEIGFNITFCPYCLMSDWISVLGTLYSAQAPTVEWMNLQCYDGGAFNIPAEWATAVSNAGLGINGATFTVPGLWCCNTSKPGDGSTPAAMQKKFATWQGQMATAKLSSLQGGFVWNYDDVLANQNSNACNPAYSGSKSSAAYDAALVAGLNS
ncbi:MAG: hypothetical protein H7062_21105 [Candidatus Saccharimonas sp.]|nr:hypothetical protein [Planctomycetaceae bacterium]